MREQVGHQDLTASIWVSGCTRVDSVSQWTLEACPQPWSNETSILYIGVSKMISSGLPNPAH